MEALPPVGAHQRFTPATPVTRWPKAIEKGVHTDALSEVW